MTTEQTTAWLQERGIAIKPDTVKRHCQRGNIPATKPGRDWDISEAALQQFIEARRGPGWQLGRARKVD